MASVTTPRTRHRFFLATVCLLAAAPIIKLGDIQLLEVFLFFHLLWLALELASRQFRVRLNDIWRSIGVCYAFFFIAVLVLALASLRFRFYPAEQQMSLIKLPFMLSLARTTEIFLGTFYMIYIASILRDNPPTRLFAIQTYFWTGFATALYSLLSLPLFLAANLNLGFYSTMRARGLFNEGGPYGLYLISLMVAGLVLYHVKGITRTKMFLAAAIIIPVFLMTQSKSAIFACLFLFLLNIFVAGTLRVKVSLLATASIFALSILTLTDFTPRVMSYVQEYQLVQEIGGYVDQNAYGGFGGRLAGAILVPRMIAAHPLTGIGLGNYPLLFDDPHYLQGLPFTINWELPGIGIAGYIAELGIPLFLYLLVLLCAPAWLAYRTKSPTIILILAAVQPLVHLFGVQLNFYYPWVCSGIALSFMNSGISQKSIKRRKSRQFSRLLYSSSS
jgi:hypothetical protein